MFVFQTSIYHRLCYDVYTINLKNNDCFTMNVYLRTKYSNCKPAILLISQISSIDSVGDNTCNMHSPWLLYSKDSLYERPIS